MILCIFAPSLRYYLHLELVYLKQIIFYTFGHQAEYPISCCSWPINFQQKNCMQHIISCFLVKLEGFLKRLAIGSYQLIVYAESLTNY